MEVKVQSIALDEFVDFITSSPSLEAIASYHLSPEANAHISYLLDANRNGTLTSEERAELDEYDRLEHLMRMVKYKAMEKLQQK